MRTLDKHQLEQMGFNPPEGPCISHGRLLRFFIFRDRPWLGVEEYLSGGTSPDEPTESEIYAVNYGTHKMEAIQSLEDIQFFLYRNY
ncbi:hypothetical protein [Parapedobacter sp.]